MPLPDPRFILCPPLQEYFVDKDTGLPLSGGVVTFYRDTDRTVLKPVYQISGTPGNYVYIPILNNPLTLTSVGTFADDNGDDIVPYLFPYEGTPDNSTGEIDLYYITVYAANPPVGTGALQFTREAWPSIGIDNNPTDNFEGTENELANPQFVTVNFSPDPATSNYVFNVVGAGTVNTIAPDWDIVTSGTGSVTVSQVAITDINAVSNPPYVLDIQSTGITSLTLRQRLLNSPRLMANGFVNGSFVVASQDALPHTLAMNYVPSNGTQYVIASGASTNDGNYSSISGTIEVAGLPSIINPDAATTGYIDITLTIPIGAHIRVSSFQIVGVQNITSSTPFLQQSTARQKDHLWHYYQDQVIVQPKASILTGWNFPLNPWQFRTTAASTITASQYTADQTIVSLQTASSLQALRTSDGYFGVQPVTAAGQGKFAIIQYVDSRTIVAYWGNLVSSLVRLGISTTHATALNVKMRLIYRSNVPPAVDPISSWASTDPVFTAGWTALTPINDPVYPISSATLSNITFEGFQLPSIPSSTAMVGIVLYTTNTLNSAATADLLYLERASLVPNRFAVDSPPQTYDQVLREASFYFEKSYAPDILPGHIIAGGCLQAHQNTRINGGNTELVCSTFGFPFKVPARTDAPVVILYSPTSGTSVVVFGEVSVNGGGASVDISTTNWLELQKSNTGVSYQATNKTTTFAASVGTTFIDAWIFYHYTKDARLGLVA